MSDDRPSVADKRAAFHALHQAGCFVMPNPWDVGSGLVLQSLGFKALATTSAGLAWTLGRPDNRISLDDALTHLSAMARSIDLPVNADFENGFADAPDQVASNVARATETGVAGLSIEDSTGEVAAPLYDFTLAVERMAAAHAAIDAGGTAVVLTARSEGFIAGRPDLEETIRRLVAYAEAGADCLYAPGLTDEEHIAAVVRAVAPKPVNVLTFGLPVATLARLGVRRISVGGALAKMAFGALERAAREIADDGTFTAVRQGATGADLNALFAAATQGQG